MPGMRPAACRGDGVQSVLQARVRLSFAQGVQVMALSGALENRKTRRLARSLEMPPWAALGLMEALWGWARRAARSGRIETSQWEDVADYLGWQKPVEDLRAKLVDAGLVDDMGGWDWIHDWHQHADDVTRRNLERQGKVFANGAPTRGWKVDRSPSPPAETVASSSGNAKSSSKADSDEHVTRAREPEAAAEAVAEEERRRGVADLFPSSSRTPEMEVRAFLAANIGRFLDAYPGGGGKPGALNAAIAAYGRDSADVSVVDWWNGVMESLGAYIGAMRGKEHRDAIFWFLDGFHRRSWGRRPQRQRSAPEDLPSSPPPPPPVAGAVLDQAAVLPDPDPPRVPLPDRSRVLEMPSTLGAIGARSRTNCRRCGGTGVVEAPDVEHWTELERAGISALEVIERCRQVVKACGCRALGTPQSISVRSVG